MIYKKRRVVKKKKIYFSFLDLKWIKGIQKYHKVLSFSLKFVTILSLLNLANFSSASFICLFIVFTNCFASFALATLSPLSGILQNVIQSVYPSPVALDIYYDLTTLIMLLLNIDMGVLFSSITTAP